MFAWGEPSRVDPSVRGGPILPPMAPPGAPPVLSVSMLNSLVRGVLHETLPPEIHLVGQVSNIARAAGGHLYFTMKDDAAEVRCVMWKTQAATLRFRPADGMEVVATGMVDVYE